MEFSPARIFPEPIAQFTRTVEVENRMCLGTGIGRAELQGIAL